MPSIVTTVRSEGRLQCLKSPYCVTYGRISPRPSETDSLDIQRAELAAYAMSKGWTLAGHHEDNMRSGSELMRPGIQQALALLRRGDVLLVRDLSRFARDVAVALALEAEIRRIGAYLATQESGIVLDPTADELEYHDAVLPRFVKYWSDARDRLVKNRRTSSRMLEHQANGRPMGSRPPAGKMRLDGVLVDCPEELEAGRRAAELAGQGLTWARIGRRLKREIPDLRSHEPRFVKKLAEAHGARNGR